MRSTKELLRGKFWRISRKIYKKCKVIIGYKYVMDLQIGYRNKQIKLAIL